MIMGNGSAGPSLPETHTLGGDAEGAGSCV